MEAIQAFSARTAENPGKQAFPAFCHFAGHSIRVCRNELPFKMIRLNSNETGVRDIPDFPVISRGIYGVGGGVEVSSGEWGVLS
jgi:hypothetical protein